MLQVLPAVDAPSGARRRPVLQTKVATDTRKVCRGYKTLESFDLKPRYSSGELPGKCIKCLAEQELDSCLREFLRGEDNEEVKRRFEMLLAFLKSPESRKLRDASEKYLAEGKKVTLKLSFTKGKPKYKLNID